MINIIDTAGHSVFVCWNCHKAAAVSDVNVFIAFQQQVITSQMANTSQEWTSSYNLFVM